MLHFSTPSPERFSALAPEPTDDGESVDMAPMAHPPRSRPTPPARRERPAARAWFWIAAVLGTVHAAWSLYWAVGGTILLDTVGQWAVKASREDPALAFWGLLAITVIKLAAAWTPLLAETGSVPARRVWRVLSWVGGPGLVLYGGVNAVAAGASLLGWVDSGVTDRRALLGHAILWDPLFATWGLALLIGLVLSRTIENPQPSSTGRRRSWSR